MKRSPNPEEPLKEPFQLFDDALFLRCAIAAAEARCGWHNAVNVGASGFYLAVAESVLNDKHSHR